MSLLPFLPLSRIAGEGAERREAGEGNYAAGSKFIATPFMQ